MIPDFEEELNDLITRMQRDGVGYDDLISGLELKIMALREEEKENEDID